MMRRLFVLLLAIGLVALTAQPAFAKLKKPELLTEDAAAVVKGGSAWLALTWEAEDALEDFRVVVTDDDNAVIAYPESTGDYTAPFQSSDLVAGEIDFTAIRIDVPYDEKSKNLKITVQASWNNGERRDSSEFKVKIPLVDYQGEDFAQLTEEVTVPAGAATWVEVAYSGLAPQLEGFSVAAAEAGGLPITYPAYGDATSLDHDAVLDAGETDVVRFSVDTTNVPVGRYEVGLVIRYRSGGASGQSDGALVVTVTQ